MKTTIKNFIAISVLAFGCTFGASASVINERESSSSTVEAEKRFDIVQAGNSLMTLDASFASSEFFATGSLNSEFDFQQEAQRINQRIADREEARAVRKIMDKSFQAFAEGNAIEFLNEPTDFRAEAQLLIKMAADKAEANAISKLVLEGKVFINR